MAECLLRNAVDAKGACAGSIVRVTSYVFQLPDNSGHWVVLEHLQTLLEKVTLQP